MEMSGFEELKSRIESFKRRFHYRQLWLGVFSFITLNLSLFFLLIGLEYELWFNSQTRTILFFFYLSTVLLSAYWFLIKPILTISHLRKGISDEDAAKVIATHFPEIEDRLINTLQLGEQTGNDLLTAAIEKKNILFRSFSFPQAVDFKPVRKYAMIVCGIFLLLLLASFINPRLLSETPERIVYFNKSFEREAPFRFVIENEALTGFRGENFQLDARIEGEVLPEKVSLFVDGAKVPATQDKQFISYAFENLQSDRFIVFEAAGFRSKTYQLVVNDRPNLVAMLIKTTEPAYTGGQQRMIENTGNIVIPEGTTVRWEINTRTTDSVQFQMSKEIQAVSRVDDTLFAHEDRVLESSDYQIQLFNAYSRNVSNLRYSIEVVKDEFPKITTTFFPDSISFQSLIIAGSISDDYGLGRLNLNYRKTGEERFKTEGIAINTSVRSQSYFANWSLDSLGLAAGERLEVFLSVYDNDQVNGSKVTRSASFFMKSPSGEEIEKLLDKKEASVTDGLAESEEKAQEIADRLEEIEDRLKSQQTFDWQEEKMVNDVIKDREKLDKQIEQLQKDHEDLRKSNERFQDQSQNIQEKNKKLQQLLNELMDEKTRELYEKLQELMKQDTPSDQLSQQLNELKKSERNLERDLERAMELFKRLRVESALEQNLQKLDTLSQQQNKAAQNPEDPSLQEDINDQFDSFREKMDEVKQLNQELKRPEALEDFDFEERQIAKKLREILEEMNQEGQEIDEQSQGETREENTEKSGSEKTPSNSGEQPKSGTQQKQQNAAQKMKQLSQKLSKMQGGMQMEMMQANLDQLRDILDNLIKLSFNQEDILTEMREVNQSDPRFLELSQDQLKLKDDAKVIQDSLLSLASRVVQLSSFVTREVTSINENIDEAIEFLKDRNRNRALSGQQFAMTSINNLALLLDDTMQQMQMAMAESMGNSSSGEKKSQGLPDLQELQNQLGEKINELKGSGKSGRELSEELAQLTAEQEMIRRQLEMIKEAKEGKPGGGLGGNELKEAIQMMEKNEVDLVNKRLSQQLINRQKQIETRMLEADKAQRNQEMEEEREADKPTMISREIPPGFEKYLELKKKEIELLKTIPLDLNPFYKKEVNDYFRRLSSQQEND